MITRYQTGYWYFQRQKYKFMLSKLSRMFLVEINSIKMAMHHREVQSMSLQTAYLGILIFKMTLKSKYKKTECIL